jgi:histidine ammonia-lyase
MGMTSALKFAHVVKNVELIIAIELICAAEGLEFLKPLQPGPKILDAYEKVRQVVPPLHRDVPLSGFIEAVVPLVRTMG